MLSLTALVPLAHARPPDQTWIEGSYDGADLDEIVVAATSIDAVSKVRVPVERLDALAAGPPSPVFEPGQGSPPDAATLVPGSTPRYRRTPRSPPAA